MTPGIYGDIPAAQYHADDLGCDAPMLSASIATTLLTQSPKHAWAKHAKLGGFPEEPRDIFDLGEAAHAYILEGTEDRYAVIDAKDWRTNAAKDAREAARAKGLTPLLTEQVAKVRAMAHAVRSQLAEFADTPQPFTNGKPEQTLVWQEDEHVWCKARLDWLHDDFLTIDDLKTGAISAKPDQWTRTIYSMNRDVQAAFYLRGLAAQLGQYHFPPKFRWIAVENKFPYATSVISLGPEALAIAQQKVEAAISTWRECLHFDRWPAYPLRTVYAQPPAWIADQWQMEEEPF